MEDPVITLAGHSYERTEIMRWFRTHQTDPKTGEKLQSKRVTPNHSLKSAIQDWKEQNPGPW